MILKQVQIEMQELSWRMYKANLSPSNMRTT